LVGVRVGKAADAEKNKEGQDGFEEVVPGQEEVRVEKAPAAKECHEKKLKPPGNPAKKRLGNAWKRGRDQ